MESFLSLHKKTRKLTSLVENRTVYNAEYSELNIFETYEIAEKVVLNFDLPIIASMITGKKTLHFDGMSPIKYLPNEFIIAPANTQVSIDFPTATKTNPTQCLALTIDPAKINEIVTSFNTHVTIENENNNWKLNEMTSHLTSNNEIKHLLNRLSYTFVKNTKTKDVLLDLMIQELIVRLLQTKAKHIFLNDSFKALSDTRIGVVIKYIKEHLTDRNITIEVLANKAHMSSSHFFKQFKNTLGVSPIEFINSERIKFSKKLISKNLNDSISEVAYKSGFNSVSYFSRQFKNHELIIPSQYRKFIMQSNY